MEPEFKSHLKELLNHADELESLIHKSTTYNPDNSTCNVEYLSRVDVLRNQILRPEPVTFAVLEEAMHNLRHAHRLPIQDDEPNWKYVVDIEECMAEVMRAQGEEAKADAVLRRLATIKETLEFEEIMRASA